MRFLADMCVDVRVVKWLHQKGHDAAYLRDECLHWMPNVQVAGMNSAGLKMQAE